MSPFFTGFVTGLGLILPIGAQNAFVLKLGLLRQHVGVVALLCAAMDTVLMAAGTAMVGVALGSFSVLLTVLKVLGVAFLVVYGARAFYNAYLHQQARDEAAPLVSMSLKTAVLTCMGFTLLNPHVYLDTFLLIGSISIQYQPAHWYFTLGAMGASLGWFLLLGYGARLLTPWFARRVTWMVLEFVIGCIMWTIAYHIAFLPIV